MNRRKYQKPTCCQVNVDFHCRLMAGSEPPPFTSTRTDYGDAINDDWD